MMAQKLMVLWTSTVVMAGKFPAAAHDVRVLIDDLERDVAEHTWTMEALHRAIDEAQAMQRDFLQEWDGARDAWQNFTSRLRGLFQR